MTSKDDDITRIMGFPPAEPSEFEKALEVADKQIAEDAAMNEDNPLVNRPSPGMAWLRRRFQAQQTNVKSGLVVPNDEPKPEPDDDFV